MNTLSLPPRFFLVGVLGLLGTSAAGADPCKSGLRVNQRPGPYSSVVATGPLRGQSHCFICEAADKPMVIIFARSLGEPLGILVNRIDKTLARHKDANLQAWITFLAEDQPSFDPKVVAWGKKHAVQNIPLGIFEDLVGPPTYLLHREADVTVLVAVKQRVTANFAFRVGELNPEGVSQVIRAITTILPAKKK